MFTISLEFAFNPLIGYKHLEGRFVAQVPHLGMLGTTVGRSFSIMRHDPCFLGVWTLGGILILRAEHVLSKNDGLHSEIKGVVQKRFQ